MSLGIASVRDHDHEPVETFPLEFLETDTRVAFDRVRRLLMRRRHELGLTQRDVSRVTNFSQPYVCNLENGKVRTPGLTNLTRWAECLGLGIRLKIYAAGIRIMIWELPSV